MATVRGSQCYPCIVVGIRSGTVAALAIITSGRCHEAEGRACGDANAYRIRAGNNRREIGMYSDIVGNLRALRVIRDINTDRK